MGQGHVRLRKSPINAANVAIERRPQQFTAWFRSATIERGP